MAMYANGTSRPRRTLGAVGRVRAVAQRARERFVEDLDAAMARAGELGGAVHAGPIDIGPGRLAVVADPQGAFFALYEGQMDP